MCNDSRTILHKSCHNPKNCQCAESRSLLLTIFILAPESTTNSLSSGSFFDAAGITHFSAGEQNVELVYVSLMKMFDLYFSKRWSFFSRILACRCVDCVNRILRIDPKILHRVFPGLFLFEKPMGPGLARGNPTVAQFSQQPQHSCRRCLFFCGNSSLSLAFCLVVHQPYDAGSNTYPRLYIPFLFCKNWHSEYSQGHRVQVLFK